MAEGYIHQLRNWLGQSLVWDFAERQRLLRGVVARGHGMDPAEYSRPFPGTNNMTTVSLGNLGASGDNQLTPDQIASIVVAAMGRAMPAPAPPTPPIAPVQPPPAIQPVAIRQEAKRAWKDWLWPVLAAIGLAAGAAGTTVAIIGANARDSEYEVRFYDAEGRPIAVPHISQRPKQ